MLFEFLKKHMMRELDLTQTFLDKALRHIHETRSRRATTLHIALGEISELDQISIQTHWDDLSKGTPAEHAQLNFRLITAEVQCMACFQKYQLADKKYYVLFVEALAPKF